MSQVSQASSSPSSNTGFQAHEPNSSIIELFIESQALRFGKFTTKSARQTPYFIDTSQLYLGSKWLKVMNAFVERVLQAHFGSIEAIFGAAYKGIPISTSFAALWHQKTGLDTPFFFDRKEPKTHGEKGHLVGMSSKVMSSSQLSVLVCDDVLTSGISLRQSLLALQQIETVKVVGAAVLVDRWEHSISDPSLSARQSLETEFSIPIISLLDLGHILNHLRSSSAEDSLSTHLADMEAYLSSYGVC